MITVIGINFDEKRFKFTVAFLIWKWRVDDKCGLAQIKRR